MKTKISLIVPTYNEAEIICSFLKKTLLVLKKIKKNYKSEIIIVDDNSPDKTAEVIKRDFKGFPQLKVFVRKNVRGLGTAIAYGIRKSQGKIIIGIDADGNHEIDKIPSLLKNLKKNDLVVASRFIKGGGKESAFDSIRHLGSFFLNFLLKVFLDFPIWDNTSGFYAIKKKKLEKLGLKRIYYGYGDYHLRLVYLAKIKKYKIKEIPYVYQKRLGGKSKSKLIKMFFSYLKEGIRLKKEFTFCNKGKV